MEQQLFWKWKSFKAENFKHIGDQNWTGHRFVTVLGDNTVGKSVSLMAMQMPLVSTLCTPDLIADGFDEATATLELEMSDGSQGLTLSRRIKREGSPNRTIWKLFTMMAGKSKRRWKRSQKNWRMGLD